MAPLPALLLALSPVVAAAFRPALRIHHAPLALLPPAPHPELFRLRGGGDDASLPIQLRPGLQTDQGHRVADQAPKRVHADGVPRVP